MDELTFLDYLIIGSYFAVLVGVGFYYRKMASNSLDDYFLGGRKLPWWALGISGMAAWLDLTGTMLITSFLFLLGPTALFFEIRGGAGLVLVFMFIFIGKWHRRSGLMTSAEWMIFRFGNNKWGKFARITQAFALIIFGIGTLAYAIKGIGLFFSMFIPFGPSTCALILLGVTCIYTIQSGFYGVVITDVFQGFCVLLGSIFIIVFSMKMVAGVDIIHMAEQVTGNQDWGNVLPSWKVNMPSGYEHYNYLNLVVLFFLIKTVYQGMGMFVDNRYFGAAGERECGLLGFMSGWAILMRWPLMMGFAILGIVFIKDTIPDQAIFQDAASAVHQYFENQGIAVTANIWQEKLADILNSPENYGNLPAKLTSILGERWYDKLSLVSYEGTVFPERILPAVLKHVIPRGVRGLIIVALMAASMSTINTLINNSTTLFTRDLYQGYFRSKAKNSELIYISWGFGLLLSAISFIVAFYATNINDIWSWIMAGLIGGLVVPSFLRLYWWRFNGGGFAIGLCAGIIAAVLQRIIFPEMHEWYQFFLILAIGFIASILGTYLTKPTSFEVVERFYIKTRPFGVWGKFKDSLAPETRVATKEEHKNDIISIPFGLLWMISMLLLPLLAMVLNWVAFGITLVLFIISLVGLYYFWYRHLPPPASKKKIEQRHTTPVDQVVTESYKN
jgi:Na+/proline symporter